MYTAITVFVNNTKKVSDETSIQTLARVLSAWSNIGNSVVHLLLIIYIKVNEGNESAYWLKERELDPNPAAGPIGLTILNFAAGMCSAHRKYPKFPLVWNSFVVVAGTFIPLVWLRFLEEGLSTWPYFIVFVWFMIFAMELSAFSTSWTYYLIQTKDPESKKDD